MTVSSVFEANGTAYYVMDCVEGGNIERSPENDGV